MIVLPCVLACCALVGWGADIELLRRFGTSSVTMNPASAVAFLALGGGIMLREDGGRRARILAAASIAAGGLIGASTLLDIAAGTHMHLDRVLFAAKLGLGYDRPSRMAPNTALCLVMDSLALLLMTRRSGRAVVAAQTLALCTALIALFAVVGHLYGVDAFYVVGALHPVALPAALGLLSLSGFVLARTASCGLLAPLSDPGPAGRTGRALLPAAIAIPVLCGWLRQQGESAGLFTGEIGVALMVMLTILMLTALIWQNTRWLLAADMLRRAAEAEVAHMATHDFLTGLPNRGHFMDRLIARMGRRPPAAARFAVIAMDLDGFKQVNDRLGHAAGDALLRDVGTHLLQCQRRRDDLVARVGGDEFVMLLDGIAAAQEAAGVAMRILQTMPRRFGPPGRDVAIGISLGIAVADRTHQTPEALLADADRALYRAKRNGRGRCVVHGVEDKEALLF